MPNGGLTPFAPRHHSLLGLSPRTAGRTPITAPLACPVLSVMPAGKRSITLRYRDSAARVSSKAKPPGMTACQIFAADSARADH